MRPSTSARAAAVTAAGAFLACLTACSSSGSSATVTPSGSDTPAGSSQPSQGSSTSSSMSSSSAPESGSSAQSSGSSAPSSGSSSVSVPPGGVLSSDKAFSFMPPKKWKKTPQSVAVIAVQAPAPQDKVTTNINVVVRPAQGATVDAAVSQSKIAWRGRGAKVVDRPDTKIDGEVAKGYELTRTASGLSVTQGQLITIHDGRAYIVTTTSSSKAGALAAARSATGGVLSSWKWAPAPGA